MIKKILIFMLFSLWLIVNVANAAENKAIDYHAMAKTETQMWKAYYAKDMEKVFHDINDMIKIQYSIDNPEALQQVSTQFTTAVGKFSSMPQKSTTQQQYNKEVLPLVITAYQSLQKAVRADWNATQIAKDELAWWIARRQENTANPESVAKKMVKVYVAIYGDQGKEFFMRSAYLRAVAARYRDQCQRDWGGVTEQDWQTINSILNDSYRALNQGIEANNKN